MGHVHHATALQQVRTHSSTLQLAKAAESNLHVPVYVCVCVRVEFRSMLLSTQCHKKSASKHIGV